MGRLGRILVTGAAAGALALGTLAGAAAATSHPAPAGPRMYFGMYFGGKQAAHLDTMSHGIRTRGEGWT